jgi:hypothetical protein
LFRVDGAGQLADADSFFEGGQPVNRMTDDIAASDERMNFALTQTKAAL